MSRLQTGPRLPQELVDKIGSGVGNSSKKSHTISRKDARKQGRLDKKKQIAKRSKNHHSIKTNAKPVRVAPVKTTTERSGSVVQQRRHVEVDDFDSTSEDGASDNLDMESSSVESDAEPQLSAPPAKMSKTARARLEQEDAEIAALERKLGIKKKGNKTGLEDGLDDLLGEIDDAVTGESTGDKRKQQADEDWLKQKRRKVEQLDGDYDGFEGFSNDEDMLATDDGEDSDDLSEEDDDDADDNDDDQDFSHSDDADHPTTSASPKFVVPARENPYRAPITADEQSATAKYVPPSLRRTAATQDETILRLNRKIQGLVNRLSESNLLPIIASVEALYQDNPRGHVTDGLIHTLLAIVADEASLTDTFITLHSGFVAGLYRVIGVDFGAQLLERIVQTLDISSVATDAEPADKKQVNLVSLLASLYIFSVISSTIIYDLIRHYITNFSELTTELLLRIIRTCGPQLRSDDPSALKDVVTLVATKTSAMPASSISVRQSFMVETITDLKNNKLKGGLGASTTRAEMFPRMKKLLGQVKGRGGSGGSSEPIRVTLSDLRDADKKGKWWLVGASWQDPIKMSGVAAEDDDDDTPATTTMMTTTTSVPKSQTQPPPGADLLALARDLGMNTDVRRSVFAAIMSAVDYRDAAARVAKLGLKNRQLVQIPRVLVRCVTAEAGYNPYYTYVAKELCRKGKREVRMGFQFALWDVFRRTGEDQEGDGDDGDHDNDDGEQGRLEMNEVVSLAKLFAVLLKAEALPISALKKLDWAYLKPQTGLFLEVMLTVLILDKAKGDASAGDILGRAANVEGLRQGFAIWIREVLVRSEVPDKRRHRDKVRQVCEAVLERLKLGPVAQETTVDHSE